MIHFSVKVKVISSKMAETYQPSHGISYPSSGCYDGNLETYCMTKKVESPYLQLQFLAIYVHNVMLINRDATGRSEEDRKKIIERINGAKVELLDQQKIIKSCGTIDTSQEKHTFFIDCRGVGTTLKIHLQRKDYFNLGEVVIYTLGNVN